jgi:hypothetical protein
MKEALLNNVTFSSEQLDAQLKEFYEKSKVKLATWKDEA